MEKMTGNGFLIFKYFCFSTHTQLFDNIIIIMMMIKLLRPNSFKRAKFPPVV